MDYTVRVEVIESQGYVVAEVNLNMVGEWLLGPLEEVHCAKKVALLLKLSPWDLSLRPRIFRLDKNGVQEFGSTWE